MKMNFIAAAILTLGISGGIAGLTPALAGEGNGEPFNNNRAAVNVQVAPSGAVARDVGSAQYPNTAGRPGSELALLDNSQVLPVNGSEGAVQTANSLPRGFEEGTVAYAQARSTQQWMVAHLGRTSSSRLAAR